MKLLLPFLLLTLKPSSGYHSPLNDFQRSEGRELVPTSWNTARVSLLYSLTLEDCAQRCSKSLELQVSRLWHLSLPAISRKTAKGCTCGVATVTATAVALKFTSAENSFLAKTSKSWPTSQEEVKPLGAFNYETRPIVTCKHLPWVGNRSNAEVKRNVNCDLYEKKGESGVISQRQSMSESASWVKGKTTGGKFPPRGAGSPASSGGPSFPMITGEMLGRAEIV
ncbi:hypothetical protein fugu_005021 [Takifugu bimaculatus]|uniref:Uncharacterized protein n=1 Tax=Takifugu bimaculatus TaxID=433685 RepID=A0A4Z2B9W9_9TELE|nr:hypothetical protein fugu_005021 [Takifugu bimaculatus]